VKSFFPLPFCSFSTPRENMDRICRPARLLQVAVSTRFQGITFLRVGPISITLSPEVPGLSFRPILSRLTLPLTACLCLSAHVRRCGQVPRQFTPKTPMVLKRLVALSRFVFLCRFLPSRPTPPPLNPLPAARKSARTPRSNVLCLSLKFKHPICLFFTKVPPKGAFSAPRPIGGE